MESKYFRDFGATDFAADEEPVARLDVSGRGFGCGIEFPEIAEEEFAGGLA